MMYKSSAIVVLILLSAGCVDSAPPKGHIYADEPIRIIRTKADLQANVGQLVQMEGQPRNYRRGAVVTGAFGTVKIPHLGQWSGNLKDAPVVVEGRLVTTPAGVRTPDAPVVASTQEEGGDVWYELRDARWWKSK